MGVVKNKFGQSSGVQVLWMDDEPGFLRVLNDALEEEQLGVAIEAATSIPEAEEKLQSERYCAFVADLRMDDSDPAGQNGAVFLLEVNRRYRALPTFVYTAWLNDPIYEELLLSSYVIAAVSKIMEWSRPVSRLPFITKLQEFAFNFSRVKDFKPERIQFGDYISNPNKYRDQTAVHWLKHRLWIEPDMERQNLAWCVVCGFSIVKGSKDIFDFPDEEALVKIGRECNLVPFAYSKCYAPESIDPSTTSGSAWVSTLLNNDKYPTLRVRIGGDVLSADFDTGAYQTFVSDNLVERGVFDFLRESESVHLNETFTYWTKKVSMALVGTDGREKAERLPVNIVDSWHDSPFVKINPKRMALVGRDVLRAFKCRVLLDSTERSTSVKMLAESQAVEGPTVNRLYPGVEAFNAGYLEVGNNHTIYFEEHGKPDGKPALYLHGGPGGGCDPNSHRFFDPSHYRVVLFDQRGCGRSRPHACLEANDTWALVNDIELLRQKLGVDRWVVFGGSWGSALALAYSETHPDRVSALVLRGIFLLRQSELDWFYKEGANHIFPDEWAMFVSVIPKKERSNLLKAYHKRLTDGDENTQLKAARAWTLWEMRTSTLLPDPKRAARAEEDGFCIAFAKIETHYFLNGGFFRPETQVIDNIDRIRHIPAVIVQGRHDVVCPSRTAWELHQAWPEADFRIVPDAGHSAYEPGIVHELVAATDRFR